MTDAVSALREVDAVTIQIVVDNSIEWFHSHQVPGFSFEIPQHLPTAPRDDKTGLPILDLENYCCGAHGLSLLIKTVRDDEQHTILFDAGPESKSIARNVDALKLDMAPVERIVLSHWHSDHSGGILQALNLIKQSQSRAASPDRLIPVDLHPDRPIRRGIQPPTADKPVCVLAPDPTFDQIQQAGGTVDLHAEAHTICKDSMYVSGQIPRITSFESGLMGGMQWVEDTNGQNGKWDTEKGRWIMDERYLAISVKGKGMIVFSSCSHAGIVNVCRDVVSKFNKPIFMVLGGFHLGGLFEVDRIEPTARYFSQELKPTVQHLLPLHCTGFKAKVALTNALGDRVLPFATGSKIVIEASP